MKPLAPIRSEQENVIPLINVVFLLLIFFMISGQMVQPESLAVSPPEVQSKYDIASMETKLLVDKHGTIMFGKKKLIVADIPAVFKDKAKSPLMVKIDQNCVRQCFLPVLSALRQAGLKKIRLVTLQAASGTPSQSL